ncbi:MAG: TetR/AcrR family transcriptional regulator [Actinomycetota bacterium]|nr:TetR/AcrR family transcriptional regulator [Actinomycetota bacterium]
MGVEEDPRVTRSKEKIRAATTSELCEHGFAAATVEAIASRCGVAKTTIYRHWGSREELLLDTMRCSIAERADDAPTDDPRDDIVRFLTSLAHGLAHDDVFPAAIRLAVEADSDPGLAELHREFKNERRAHFASVLERARAAGVIRADADLDLVSDRLLGPIFYRRIIHHEGVGPDYVVALCDDVLGPAPAGGPAQDDVRSHAASPPT